MLLLFLACAPPDETPDTDTDADSDTDTDADSDTDTDADTDSDTDCDTVTTIGWDEPTSRGASADDVFGYGIGEVTEALFWDDGSESVYTLTTVAPSEATASSHGTWPDCRVELTVDVPWTFTTEDGRITAAGTTQWRLVDSEPTDEVSYLRIAEELDGTEADVEWLETDSVRTLVSVVERNGERALRVFEEWELSYTTNMLCTRGAESADELVCEEEDDTDSTD